MMVKVIKIMEIPGELTEKTSFQKVCASRKQILSIDKKAIFFYKKYLPIQSVLSNCSENSEHP